MALPASLIQQVENHGCFTGCYAPEWIAPVCLQPAQPPQSVVMVSCHDCLSFKVGVLQSLLPPGTSASSLADQLTQHNRRRRGYGLSSAGYHARGPGFWLQAAYYPCGLFLLDGERSRATGTDLDLLLLAFRHGVIAPPDPRMLDPRLYVTQTIHVNYGAAIGPVACKQDLLSSPQCRLQAHKGFQRVTLAEFQPISSQAKPPAPASAPRNAAKALKLGDICPVCKGEVKLRPLLHGTYLGCLC
jgi:hypothetical protein